MAEIRGLTIAIGADTKQFNKDIKKVDREIRSTNNQVNALTKSLELDFDDKRFGEAMNLAQKVIEDTEFKAQKLREEIKYLEDSGNINTDAYKKLQTQLIRTESDAVLLKNKLDEIKNLKLDRLSEQFTSVGDGISKAGKALKPFSVAATGLLASFTAIGVTAVGTADDISKISSQLNISAESLQRWQYLAMQTNVEFDELRDSFITVQAEVGKLARGEIDNASQALMDLGFTAEDAAAPMEKNFEKIVNALSAIEDPAQRALIATKLFGESAAARIGPLLNAGADGMAALTAEFESLGYMTNEQVASLTEFDNTINTLKTSLTNIKNQIGVALLPLMLSFAAFMSEKVVPAIQKLSEWFGNLSESGQKLLFGGLAVVAGLSPVLSLIGKITSGIGGLIGSTGALTKALSLLSAHPIIAIIGLIVALLAVMYTRNEQFRESINNLISALGTALAPLLNTIVKSLSSIFQALMPIIDVIATILTPIIQMLTPIITGVVDLMIKYLIPAIEFATKIITGLFNFINDLWRGILKGIENFINGIIRGVNKVIGAISEVDKFFGGDGIKQIKEVNFTSGLNSSKQETPATPKAPEVITPEQAISNTQNWNYPQTVTNNDYSNKDIKIEVVVQNYAEEVDIDKMVRDINLKLAEQL